jgi:hypothetical protein
MAKKRQPTHTRAKEMMRELPIGGGVIVIVDVRPAEGFGIKAGAVALCRAARRLAAARGAEFSGRPLREGLRLEMKCRGAGTTEVVRGDE